MPGFAVLTKMSEVIERDDTQNFLKTAVFTAKTTIASQNSRIFSVLR
jgi:hypothetical protein